MGKGGAAWKEEEEGEEKKERGRFLSPRRCGCHNDPTNFGGWDRLRKEKKGSDRWGEKKRLG